MRTDSLIILCVRKCLYESISRGKPSKYVLRNVGINTYPHVSHACMSNVHFLLIKTIEAIYQFVCIFMYMLIINIHIKESKRELRIELWKQFLKELQGETIRRYTATDDRRTAKTSAKTWDSAHRELVSQLFPNCFQTTLWSLFQKSFGNSCLKTGNNRVDW